MWKFLIEKCFEELLQTRQHIFLIHQQRSVCVIESVTLLIVFCILMMRSLSYKLYVLLCRVEIFAETLKVLCRPNCHHTFSLIP